jgi:hypothetical protein
MGMKVRDVNFQSEVPGIVAQLEERLLHTQEVIGSRPVGPISNQQPGSAFRRAIAHFWCRVPLGPSSDEDAHVEGEERGR